MRNESGRAIYDGGALIASCGDLIAAGKRFLFTDVDVTVADVDVELSRTRRASIHSMTADVSHNIFDRIVSIPGRSHAERIFIFTAAPVDTVAIR
ncbi:MAG: hypothetical protein U0936_24090 [Planctomycetaceae bacterium]